ncbi:MAG: hypothetical protein Q8Q39_00475 [bacterium]|nr:hypothetical protein [bacterium]
MEMIRMEFCAGVSMIRIRPGTAMSPGMIREEYAFLLKKAAEDEFGLVVPASNYHLDCFNAKVHAKELPWKLACHFFEVTDDDFAGVAIRQVVIDRYDQVQERDGNIMSAALEFERSGQARSRRIMPADGIVLATYAGAGIFVEEAFFEANKIPIDLRGPDDIPPEFAPGEPSDADVDDDIDEEGIEEMRKKLEQAPQGDPDHKNT